MGEREKYIMPSSNRILHIFSYFSLFSMVYVFNALALAYRVCVCMCQLIFNLKNC